MTVSTEGTSTPSPRTPTLNTHGESEQLLGPEVIEQPPVARRRGVVELVDHDDVERIGGRQRRVGAPGEGLDHREEVLAGGVLATTMDLAEVGVVEYGAVSTERLAEDLLAVSDEQQPRRSPVAERRPQAGYRARSRAVRA